MNCRSILNKELDLEHLIALHDPDVVALTETWLHDGVYDSEIAPSGFNVYRRDRGSRGGGVALLVKNIYRIARMPDAPGVEALFCKLIDRKESLVIGVVYRPPASIPEVLEQLQLYISSKTNQTTKLILCGDFNLPGINWSSFSAGSSDPINDEALIDIAFRFDLTQLVSDCTRVQDNSKSILDLVFVNGNISGKIDCEVVTGISDHMAVLVELHSLKYKNDVKYTRVPVFHSSDDASIIDRLEIAYDELCESVNLGLSDVNALWLKYKNTAHACIQLFVPFKKKKVHMSKPWITRDIIHIKRKINRLRKSLKKHTSITTRSLIRDLSRQLKDKMKIEQRSFYDVKLTHMMKESPSHFWHFIRPKSSNRDTFVINNVCTSDETEIANAFNEHFASVFTCDDKTTPTFSKFKDLPPIENLEVTEAGVFELLLNLNVRKSCGPDDLPNAFLKRYAEWSSKFLTIIFNESLSRGVLPEDWKFSKIKPLFKHGDKQLVCNYRPIALTCTCCKLLEHIIHKHISCFLESHSVLSPAQHGFRRGFSTVTQLVEIVHDFALAINNQSQIDAVFLDFAKAFDKISHSRLLMKLWAVLKNPQLCQWIQAYLGSRKQYVVFNEHFSQKLPVDSGVPQGSVLGPLLFLLFINDMVDDCGVKIRLYADDCVLYSEINSTSDQNALNFELDKVMRWCRTWQMAVNYDKCAVMTISNKKNPLLYTYTVDRKSLNRVNEFKYLGLIITDNIHWDSHITAISNKALSKLHFLRRSLKRASTICKLATFKALILPILEYANIIWDPFTQTNTRKLDRVQSKAVRFIFNSYGPSSITQLLRQADLKSITVRNKIARLKFMFKIVKGKLQSRTCDYISFSSGYSTRLRHPYSLVPFKCKNNVFKYSFFPRTVTEWNELDKDVVTVVDCDTFQALLQL